tara:strand:- start:1191 stop:3362 length:2172 start_codon:yes stop_codon:yes gene_type:complete
MPEPEFSFDRAFFRFLEALDPADQARCMSAINDFIRDPNHPGLRLGPVHGDPLGRLYKIRASLSIRILLARVGNVFVFLEPGQREDIYERARHSRFLINRGQETIRLVEWVPPHEGNQGREPAADVQPAMGDECPRVADHWEDHELIDAGFDETEVERIRNLDTMEQVLGLFEEGWDEESVQNLLDILEMTPEEWRQPALLGDPAEDRFRRAISEFGAQHMISRLFSPDEVAEIAAKPIEDWMIFLHPEQRVFVERRNDGPARVRGSAGTGKTVVALHRAAELARRFREEEDPGQILFTTFVRTLPPVFESLYDRMPDSVRGAVEFINIDRLAGQICDQDGTRRRTDPSAINPAWAKAWRTVGDDSPLGRAGLSRQYLKDEITHVIKGRGLEDLDEYLAIQRTGRGTRFTPGMREQAWELRLVWDQEMDARGTIDFPDVLIQALNIVQRREAPTYRSAIIDEAQDLTLTGLRLVRALVNGPEEIDRSDGLLIVGDGAQRIYPGAFTLRQAGLEVRGRTSVLRRNYRNTRQILAAAAAIAGRERVVDLDEEFDRIEDIGLASRDGALPLAAHCSDAESEAAYLAEQIRLLTASEAINLGDIGVFVPTNRLVNRFVHRLDGQGIPSRKLDHYDGVPTPEVKVGTYARSKGLEFKAVLLPGVEAGVVPRARTAGQDETEYLDQRALGVSQFFVAMTRARDNLILTYVGEPSELLVDALEYFENVDV